MILQLVHKLESEKELLYTLQEQYQYLLVDEFQDTNGAQMRILHKLTENPVFEGRPNIMTVGDDDQAIYRFQGADISNILNFVQHYRDVTTISLTDNYRSSKNILEHARNVITQGEERLENSLKINKNLTPHHNPKESEVSLTKTLTPTQEFAIVAEKIASELKNNDTKPSDFAVIARGHADIRNFLPHLSNKQIPFSYEQNENILREPSVKLVLKIAELLQSITHDSPKSSDILLPEILSHECFNISRLKLFELSVKSHKTKTSWLELMLNDESLHSLGEALVSIAFNYQEQSLQATLDQLLGSESVQLSDESFVMPLKNFFFSADKLEKDPESYLIHLQSLETLIKHYERYSGEQLTSLKDFVNYVKNVEKAGLNLRRNQNADELEGGVQVITAHGSKGLEFKNVYILNAVDEIWGEKSRGRSTRLSYPENMPIGLSGDRLDEKIRLFYVAMTRAKNNLYISYPEISHGSKTVFKLSFLETDKWQEENSMQRTVSQVINDTEISWRDNVIPVKSELKKAIRPLLKNYKLSPTHLNNFIDVTEGGPRFFLLQNLLHFPSALHPAAAMGSSIHTALRKAHQHMVQHHASKPIEDIVYDFRKDLESRQVPESDFEFQLKKGSDALQVFLDSRQAIFTENDISERDFRPIAITIGDADVTGIIDCMRIDKVNKTIDIVDYKTGKPMSSWKGKSDYEKVKLHKYRQQLLFYKLMIESAPEFSGYKVENAELSFIEPDNNVHIRSLKIEWDKEELEIFSKLINVVWQKILSGEFIDTSKYEQAYKGIINFEKDLLNE
jgi:DNA helicase-2/ATP-dependent DNA helicase PcrA